MTFLSVIIHFRLLKIQLVTSNDVPEDGYAYLSKPQHYPKNTVFYSVNHSVIG